MSNAQGIKRATLLQIAALLTLGIFALLFSSENQIGLTWDEPIYMTSAEQAMHWLGLIAHGQVGTAFEDVPFGTGWGLVNEHPPVTRLFTGVGWWVTRDLLPLPTSQRVGAMALAALTLALITVLTARQRGWGVGLFALAAMLSMPRLFFHAHLAAIDFPLAAMWLLATLIFYRASVGFDPMAGAHHYRRNLLQAALMVGAGLALALLTKINAVLLLPYWGLWLLGNRRLWRALPIYLLSLPIALFLLIGGWPWIWKDPIGGLWKWMEFFLNHYEIRQWFAGHLYIDTPAYLPGLIVAITTPLPLLLLALGAPLAALWQGVRRRWQGDGQEWAWFSLQLLGVAINLIYYGLIGRIHDQDRLLLPLFFHLAILSGEGFTQLILPLLWRLLGWLQVEARWQVAAATLAAFLLLWPGLSSTIYLHPFQLAYYNGLVGGIRGARSRDLETIYFASTYSHFLPELKKLPPHSKLWVMPNSWNVIDYFQLNGLLTNQLVPLRPEGWGSFYDDRGTPFAYGGLEQADYALIERRQTTFNKVIPEYAIQLEWAANKPMLAQLEIDGVPLAGLYAKE